MTSKILFAFVSHGSIDALSTSLLSLSKQLDLSSTDSANVSVLVVENKLPRDDLLINNLISSFSSYFSAFDVQVVENKGYLNGINVAIDFSFEHDYDCLVVGNPDVSFEVDYINTLCDYLDHHDFLVGVPSVGDHFGSCQNPRYINNSVEN